jgi:4-alpha-glucanotransferase
MAAPDRACGILLHPTSLPSPFGIGDMGEAAFVWIDMLKGAGQSFWQFLPLGPCDEHGSPYHCVSSFAGNPLLVSPQKLLETGLLTTNEIVGLPPLAADNVDYARVVREKERLFRAAFARFKEQDDLLAFCEEQASWLDKYTFFCAIKRQQGGRPWSAWDRGLKMCDQDDLDAFGKSNADELLYHAFLQYVFFEQWDAVRDYAKENGVWLIGDIPMYVAFDSVDAWANGGLFEVDGGGRPLRVSGVPPDYYCATGQLWGNPLYKWDEMEKDGFAWWIARAKRSLEFADIVRLDHFRGFESFWAVPAGDTTAEHGTWAKGPGMALFSAVKEALGGLPFVAEDLGVITDEVIDLRNRAGLPGMKVLQFAFDGDPENSHLPYNISVDSVVYTGTHDNDTTAGWLATLSGGDRARVDAYVGTRTAATADDIIRLAYSTNAGLCIVPMQDVLGIGSAGRMNTPGRADGNWRWRCPGRDFVREKLARVKEFASVYGRGRPEAGA